MSFRNRPVLNRKHRPRWQDELRTQQLVVAGFALAIAVALGIFGATLWSNFHDANLRVVAVVGDTPVSHAEIARQTDILQAELSATAVTLEGLLGGARDQIINQQLQSIQELLNAASSTAADGLVTSMLIASNAEEFGIEVTPAQIDAEVAVRRTTPERAQLSLLMVHPEKAEDAPADSEPTPEAWDAAEAQAQELLDRINAGEDFGTLTVENSDHSSASGQGLLGWIVEDDALFGEFYTAAGDAAPGSVLGPLQNDEGWYLLKVNDRMEAGRNELLDELLRAVRVNEEEYRAYIRDELLRREGRNYFATRVVTRYQPQRRVSQIVIAADEGQPIPKERLRHILISPLPGADDQSTATDEEWNAALAEAEEVRSDLEAGADWSVVASEHSDDPGSATRGGVLGWYDLESIATAFVPEFASAAAALSPGELSEPVRSQFGYHIIQVMDTRTSALDQADQIIQQARQDPDAFADLARAQSEDATSAAEGGDIGWVARYQLDATRESAIFGLTEVGQVSDPVPSGSSLYIFMLTDTSEARYLPESDRTRIASNGYPRWIAELKDEAGVWIDPEFAPAPTTA